MLFILSQKICRCRLWWEYHNQIPTWLCLKLYISLFCWLSEKLLYHKGMVCEELITLLRAPNKGPCLGKSFHRNDYVFSLYSFLTKTFSPLIFHSDSQHKWKFCPDSLEICKISRHSSFTFCSGWPCPVGKALPSVGFLKPRLVTRRPAVCVYLCPSHGLSRAEEPDHSPPCSPGFNSPSPLGEEHVSLTQWVMPPLALSLCVHPHLLHSLPCVQSAVLWHCPSLLQLNKAPPSLPAESSHTYHHRG